MSLYALPFLYLNLGGEMLYILQHRIRKHKINTHKQNKVMQDIVRRMLSDSILSTLFTAQPLITQKRLKANFTKLTNASIINLNDNSMAKLYDLMLMTFKYQLLLCKSGHELLLLTLNHLDALREMVTEDDCIVLINKTCTQLTDCFHTFSEGQLMIARHTLLSYLQECNRKVSLFLANNMQLSNGDFVLPHGGKVPYGAQPPGMIRYLYGHCKVEMVTLWCNYDGMEKKGCLDVMGDRTITVGENLYISIKGKDSNSTTITKKSPKTHLIQDTENKTEVHELVTDLSAKAELDFLQNVLIGFQQPPSDTDFKLILFDDPIISSTSSEHSLRKGPSNANTINITKNDSRQHISDVLKDFDAVTEKTTHKKNDGDGGVDDLLSLLDTL